MLTPKNNVLTDKGWKNITELEIGEEILTTNFAGHGIFSPVLNIIEHDYDGYIYEYSNHEKGYMNSHISLTAGSIVPTRKVRYLNSKLTGKTKKMVEIENHIIDDIAKRKDKIQLFFTSPLQFNMDDKTHKAGVVKHGAVKMTDVDYFRFLAYVIFRTAIVKGTGNKYFSWVPRIRVRDRDDPTYLFDLLDRYSIPYRIDIRPRKNSKYIGRYVVLRDGAAATRSLRRIIGDTYISKRTIPDVIMLSKSPEAIMAFLVEAVRINKSMIDLDEGRLPVQSIRFTVSNIELASQLRELLHKVGYGATINTSGYSNQVIELRISPTKYSMIPSKAIIRKRYKGKVYTLDVINEMAVCNPTELGPKYATVVKVN